MFHLNYYTRPLTDNEEEKLLLQTLRGICYYGAGGGDTGEGDPSSDYDDDDGYGDPDGGDEPVDTVGTGLANPDLGGYDDFSFDLAPGVPGAPEAPTEGTDFSIPDDSFGFINYISSGIESFISFATRGVVNPDFDGKSLMGPDRGQPGLDIGFPGLGPLGPNLTVDAGGVGLNVGSAVQFGIDTYNKGVGETFSTAFGDPPSGPTQGGTLSGGVATPGQSEFGGGGYAFGGFDDGTDDDGTDDDGSERSTQVAAGLAPPDRGTGRLHFRPGGSTYSADPSYKQGGVVRDPSYKQGGVVSAEGANPMSSFDNMVKIATDPAFDAVSPGVLQQGVFGAAGTPSMDYRLNPSYAEGGAVSVNEPRPAAGLAPQGGPQGGPQAPMGMPQMQAEMQRVMQENPQAIMQMKSVIEQLIQQGEITSEELNQAVQLATAAVQNPSLWPQLRQFAIQQGMADEQDLPQEYDQGMLFVMLMASKAVQASVGGQPSVPQSQSQPPQQTMRGGGEVPKSNNADGSVAINAHKGEYVIPQDVVLKKGTDFFDKMIGKDDKATA